MPRRRLSEYCSKKIIYNTLEHPYVGWSISTDADLASVRGFDSYVVKVDQAVKGRFKSGLVLLEVKQSGLQVAIKNLRSKGYSSFLIEPYVRHDRNKEQYLTFSYDRQGYKLSHSVNGGVDIESYHESVRSFVIDSAVDWGVLAKETGFTTEKLAGLFDSFKRNHFVFIEINPYIVKGKRITILDSAIEVDDAGMHLAAEWKESDIRVPNTSAVSSAEQAVRLLDKSSPASFNLSILNPDGAIFLLLSGGGASVVVADEVHNQGFGKQLANYGEYSGNPNQEEAERYTREILQLLLESKAKNKVLFVGGAVANFTDIAKTFGGVIAAIDDVADQLHTQGVKVFVRRGGPRQEIGLAKIEACLQRHGILGAVHSPEMSLIDVVNEVLQEVAE